jgi:hypothetical protein
MEDDTLTAINRCIRDASKQAAEVGGLSVPIIERFLRTGEETWEGAGSGRFTFAQIKQAGIYTERARAALRDLFGLLAGVLPPEAKTIPPVAPETIRQRVHSMVTGLVQRDWRDVALRELARRTYILTFPGIQAAMEAELSTGFLGACWKLLWAYFEDHGLKPVEILVEYDGMSAGEFAHVRWSAYGTKDPYSDVVVHEAAHLLHYLKPEHYGLHVRRGQERFVDVEFRHRELFAFACEAYSRVILQGDRSSRIAFADRMREEAFSFPQDCLNEVVELVAAAAHARNGWRVIREATVILQNQKRFGTTTARTI